jgi:hypothetical protein
VLGRVDDRASVEGALAYLGDGLDERRQERRAARAGAVRERE